MRRLPRLVLSMLMLMVLSPPAATAGPTTYTRGWFEGKTGAYALNTGLTQARDHGLDYAVRGWADMSVATRALYAASGIKILDSSIQRRMYTTVCPPPGGAASCRDLTAQQESEFLGWVRGHVRTTVNETQVVGYYVVDDSWTDFGPLLKKVHDVIRSVDANRGIMCGLQLDLARGGDDGSDQLRKFRRRGAVNYSPSWCDMFTIYSYANRSASYDGRSTNWSMEKTLPLALSYLRDVKGRTWSNGHLIGTPMAFDYAPRYVAGAQEWWNGPSAGELRSQVRAFCENGAKGILAHAWDSGSQMRSQIHFASNPRVTPPVVKELFNSASLQNGLAAGDRDCQLLRGS